MTPRIIAARQCSLIARQNQPLPVVLNDPSGGSLDALAARAEEYVDAAQAANTREAYRSDWAEFTSWAQTRGFEVMPAAPATVVLYLTELAEVAKTSTIARRVASINAAHRTANHPPPTADPTVMAVWAGIRRVHGAAADQAAPISVPLVALDVADAEERDEGLTVTIRRSKTDQEGVGGQVGAPYGSNPLTCPVRSLRGWLELAGISNGPLFRAVDRHGRISPARLSAAGANRIVQRAIARTGTDPRPYSAHSLRAGLATAAAEAGVPERAIMNQTGHRSLLVARSYIRRGSLFRDNAAAQVGL